MDIYFVAVQTQILAELKAEAAAVGVAAGKRFTGRRNTKAWRLNGEIAVFRMMGTLPITRWEKHGITYDMLRDGSNAGIVKIQPDRFRKPVNAGMRQA